MKKTSIFGVLDQIAKNNGYNDKFELFRDYNFIPTVKIPTHKKDRNHIVAMETLC